MTSKQTTLPILGAIALVVAFTLVGGNESQATTTGTETSTRAKRLAEERAARLSAYAERVAGYEAAAERAKQGILPEPEPSPCPEGQVAWHRGRDVDLCVSPCQSDSQCEAPARCRVIEYGRDPVAPRRWAEQAPVTAQHPGVAVCDPYADVPGVLSVALAGIGPTTAEEELAVMAEAGDEVEP